MSMANKPAEKQAIMSYKREKESGPILKRFEYLGLQISIVGTAGTNGDRIRTQIPIQSRERHGNGQKGSAKKDSI